MKIDEADIIAIVNDPILWWIAMPLGAIILVMASLYIRLSYKNASSVGLTQAQCTKGLRSGIFSSIGPSISVFVVVFSMTAIIGGPLTWMRFVGIGAAPVELAAINLGAETYGAPVGSENYNLTAMVSGLYTAIINSCGWIVVGYFFIHRMEKVREKMGGGDKVWLGLISVTAMLGLFGFLSTPFILAMNDKTVACLAGFFAMGGLAILGKKVSWLKEYALGIALIIGMVAASLYS
ncbi:DUF5058 family protein [Citrobacter farmeri]|uniref:DUF5058 domain-containing protein n=1 Tax=Citrobacter amalonaticus Y19 TaxID=1261127 RepID=A0A0F6TTA2_CITAM|nr:DUF5058 family protein [Citrobacter amalonaticus]AKE57844.1 hypothetical protein F384_01135 [Citrobacter amalonaticus Y19]EKV5656758.1 DUF5058 family protein [Citrobacter farmeri]